MAWKDIKIAKKLYIGFGIVLALTGSVGYVGISGFLSVAKMSEQLEAYTQMQTSVGDVAVARRDFFLTGDQKYADKVRSTLEVFLKLVDESSARITNTAERQELEEIRKQSQAYKAGFDEYAALTTEQKRCDDKMVETGRAAEAAATKLGGIDGTTLANHILEARRQEKNYQLRGDAKYVDEVAKSVAANYDLCERLQNRSRSSQRQIVDDVKDATEAYKAAFDQYVTAKKKQIEVGTVVGAAATVMVANSADLAKRSRDTQNSVESSAMTLTIIFALAAILSGVFVAFWISRGISKPIGQIAAVAEQVSLGEIQHDININQKDEIGILADSFRKLIDYMKNLAAASERMAANDLTVSVQPKSERDVLGNSFKTMVTNIATMIRQLGENARELVSAATEIASSAEQMSKGAKDQSDQVTQVSTAVEEMTATILESSKNAGEATNASKNAADTATSGGRIVNDTIQGMQKIAGVVRQSAESIAKLATSADQIGEIIGVIDDIADQTNLLALNAAIEAARAGEQGRGFAVVADEVRKLAERTGKATGEITEMIKGIQKETTEAVTGMEAGIQEVDKGRELADKAGNSLNEIVNMSQRVTDMIAQMATAAEEQSSAAEQISKNIEHITSVTRETASGAQQSAAAAEELNRQADGLQQMVAKFRINA